jgi:hypothetical protein
MLLAFNNNQKNIVIAAIKVLSSESALLICYLALVIKNVKTKTFPNGYKLIDMICLNCGEEILADDAKVGLCCFSKNLVSEAVKVTEVLKCPLYGSRL